jgi:PleD family two-component response regulator
MGVTGYDGQGKETADKLLQSADMALYKAKENGKNQFSVCIFGE